jgi:flavin reductase (DIM6/NTAB) family NADH-FMN oxidoreductase RutF
MTKKENKNEKNYSKKKLKEGILKMDTKAMYNLSYGLFILTAKEGDKDNGCIVNTVTQVTTEPNRIVVAVNKNNYTHDMIKRTGEFNVSILTENAKFDTFKHWGFQSGKNVNKADGVEFKRATNGIIYIADQTNALISAKVVSTTDLGTHTLFLADVTDCEILSSDPSVTYTYYQKNIKPAPQPQKKKGFVCNICGYIYEGDTLPPDFICPLCKHPASDFSPL